MPNQIYTMLNQNNMVNQFKQFKQMFSGDPKQQVQNLINSGRMSNAQFQQYAQMATELRKMLK